MHGSCGVQGKGKGKGKSKSIKSSVDVDKPMDSEVNSGKRSEFVKLKALDVFAGCGGMLLLTVCSVVIVQLCCFAAVQQVFLDQFFVFFFCFLFSAVLVLAIMRRLM